MRRTLAAIATAGLLTVVGVTAVNAATTDPCDALYTGTVDSEHAYSKCRLDRIEFGTQPSSSPTSTPTSASPSPTPTTASPTPTPKPTTASPTPTTASPTPTSTPTAVPGWNANLAGVPVGSMGCNSSSTTTTAVALKAQWDYWDVCGGSVVDPTSTIGNPPTGQNRAVKWVKTTADSGVYQKLNRTFTKDNWPKGGSGKTGSPTDVSGIYTTYKYFTSSDLVLNPSHGWLVIMSFKENYLDSSNNFHQDGTGWKVGCNNFTSGHQGQVWCHMTPKKFFDLADYTDRWVKWEYRLYQGAKDTTGHGGRIELWADDKLVDTGYEGDTVEGAPTSKGHVGSCVAVACSRTQAWVYAQGQYTSNQTTNGVPDWKGTHMTSYVGPTTLKPL